MGTMKVRPAVWMRPHYGFVGLLIALFALALRIQSAHVAIGVIGILVCAVGLFFVGRATDKRTARIERLNMVMFALLFTLMMFN
jgi:uncharacterized membrane protein HdeD (DUF308 family)